MSIVDPAAWSRLQRFIETARKSLEAVEDAFDDTMEADDASTPAEAEQLRRASVRLEAAGVNLCYEVGVFLKKEVSNG
tara:strand:- start:1020 stop:1253 length:234 start_codon:yes stop_codon:yes gene_type:complete